MLKFFLMAVSLYSLNLFAVQTLEVEGRAYHNSCGYYSSTAANLHFRYVGPLEPGAKVYLKYAPLGYRLSYDRDGNLGHIPFGWESPVEIEMPGTGPGVRELELSLRLRERSSNFFVDKVGFVFRILMPNGEYWDNGNQSSWGSYEAALPMNYIKCWDGNPANLPAYEKLPITINNKY